MNAREATVTTTLSLSSKAPSLSPLLVFAVIPRVAAPVQISFYAVANNFVLIFFISLAVSEFLSSDFLVVTGANAGISSRENEFHFDIASRIRSAVSSC